MNSKRASMCHLAVISAVCLISGLATAAERQPPPLAVAPFDAAEAKRHQQAWAEYLGVPLEITNSVGMKLVLIPPGEFLMGAAEQEEDERETSKPQHREDETPQHRVRITVPFYLGKYEVTQGEYQRVMGANPSRTPGENLPVVLVSWDETVEFCRRLSRMSAEQDAGRVYRLPTEAEWEYGCRAGTETPWSFGKDAQSLSDHAWHFGNSGFATHPVGTKVSNAWGLYDMHGNVWEWCADWYDAYDMVDPDDPTGPSTGSNRISRGGSWFSPAKRTLSTSRSARTPVGRSINLGFRVFSCVPASR